MLVIGLKGGASMAESGASGAAAIAAHFGSVSVVTFVTAQQFLLDMALSDVEVARGDHF